MFESCRLSAFITVWPLTASTAAVKSGDASMVLGVAPSLSLQQIEVIILFYRLTQVFVCGLKAKLIADLQTSPETDVGTGSNRSRKLLCAAQLSISNLSAGVIKCHFSFKENSATAGPAI